MISLQLMFGLVIDSLFGIACHFLLEHLLPPSWFEPARWFSKGIWWKVGLENLLQPIARGLAKNFFSNNWWVTLSHCKIITPKMA